MENTYRYFENHGCKYFPCHQMENTNGFSCLFCYCPLYLLGDKCGGNFKYSGVKRIKSCIDCDLPHLPDYYDVMMDKLEKLP